LNAWTKSNTPSWSAAAVSASFLRNNFGEFLMKQKSINTIRSITGEINNVYTWN
jgi:hypothetical protein